MSGELTKIKKIKDPIKMLKCILENESYFGFDPYYRDIRSAMLDTAAAIVRASKEPKR